MRKTAIPLFALGLTAILVTPALALTLMSDTFGYANGNLVPNGGWANYSGAATDIQVVSGRAVGSGPNANDDHKLFAARGLADKTYACFTVRIPAVAAQPKPIYFAALKDGGTSNLVSRVYVLPLSSGGWTFGISYSSTSTTVGVVPWGSALSYDTDYTVTILYDPANFTSKLWVNPASEASTSVSIVGTAGAIAVSGFGLRQSASSSTLPASPAYTGTADWGFSVDNVGVGTTFDDACLSGSTSTRNTTWGRVKTIYR